MGERPASRAASRLGRAVLSPPFPQVRGQSRLWLYLSHPSAAGLRRLHRPGLLRAPACDHRSVEQRQVDGGEASPACPSPPASPGPGRQETGAWSPCLPASLLLPTGAVAPTCPLPSPDDHFFPCPPARSPTLSPITPPASATSSSSTEARTRSSGRAGTGPASPTAASSSALK